MIVSPNRFSEKIIAFSKNKYFHVFEIASRLISGVLIVLYANSTLYPAPYSVFGYLLILVAIGLAATPPKLHIKFAVWSANSLKYYFRYLGIVFLPISFLFIYGAIGGIFA